MRIDSLLARTLLTFVLLTSSLRADEVTATTGGSAPHSNLAPSIALNYYIAWQGSLPAPDGFTGGHMIGEIRLAATNAIPGGWLRCDGQEIPVASAPELFAVVGTTYGGDGITTFAVPDLRGRVPIGVGPGVGLTSRTLGEKIGSEVSSVSVEQLPAHSHGVPGGGNSELTGDGQDHPNMQPSFAIHFLIATAGLFPTESGSGVSVDPLIAEIRMFAGNFEPGDWDFCDGRLIDIASNQALFSILGTTYGGDGTTNFRLPDLRGRTPVGSGQGLGLTNRIIGQPFGEESVSLSVAQLPVHSHEIFESGVTDPTGSDEAHANLQPSLPITFLVTPNGLFPDPDGTNEGFISEMRLFGGNFEPGSALRADGALLPIPPFVDLFSLVGTTYGGDGITVFALPDVRGRCVVGTGTGIGLSPSSLGQQRGSETVQLTIAEMPFHNHTILGVTGTSFCSGDGGDQMGCTDCPCANNAPVDTVGGCLNSVNSSAQLIPSGSASVSAADLRFEVTGLPPSNMACLISGTTRAPANMASPCFGLDSGFQTALMDGLRCTVQGLQRHGARISDASGAIGQATSAWGMPDGFFNFSAFVAGRTSHFQLIYRDDDTVTCMTGQNSSQGVSIDFAP